MRKFKEFLSDWAAAICICFGLIAIICAIWTMYKKYEPKLVNNYGRFIPIEDGSVYLDNFANKHYQTLVYDKDTKIIYIYELNISGGVSISPFYCMDTDNNPMIAIYDVGEKS